MNRYPLVDLAGIRSLKGLLATMLLAISTTVGGGNGTHNGNTTFTAVSEMRVEDWSSPEELERVWKASIAVVPQTDGRYLESTIEQLGTAVIEDRKYPLIVLLHGCAGVAKETYRRMKLFVDNGFATLTPVSFARKKYPRSCDVKSGAGGFYRGTVTLRQNDVGYVIRKARALSWVDERNVFLVGHSEGAIVAATFNDPGTPVNARVLESWTCRSGWSEYDGINAPKNEPVLALLAENDPWFRNPWSGGNCGRYVDESNRSKSIVLKQEGIRDQHELLEFKEVQHSVLDFLTLHRK